MVTTINGIIVVDLIEEYGIYQPSKPELGSPNWSSITEAQAWEDDFISRKSSFVTPPPPAIPPRQWSKGSFISLFTADEWDAATTRAETDKIAKQFLAILYNTDYVLSDDIRLSRGLDYFRYLGDITRTNEEILNS
jgi:hypothetical protein